MRDLIARWWASSLTSPPAGERRYRLKPLRFENLALNHERAHRTVQRRHAARGFFSKALIPS